MESLYKRKKLDFTSPVKECPTCTYSQTVYPGEPNGRVIPTPPLLIQNKHLKRSSTDSDPPGDASPHYHYPNNVNHSNDVTRGRTYMSDKLTSQSPRKDKVWSGDLSLTEPPLLIKSCSADLTRPSEHHRKDRMPQKCITPASMSDKYRHPIFATTTEDFKKDGVGVGHKWDKHLKPYDAHAQYMNCVSRKNGTYLNSYCSKTMMNKNIYIDCGRTVEIVNGEKDNYKHRGNEKRPYDGMHHESMYSLNRQHSSEEANSLLSTTNYKTKSIISVSSRGGSPPEGVKSNDNTQHRQLSFHHSSSSLVNFRILEKHEHYIVVYAEINGKRYEGCLTIQRKTP